MTSRRSQMPWVSGVENVIAPPVMNKMKMKLSTGSAAATFGMDSRVTPKIYFSWILAASCETREGGGGQINKLEGAQTVTEPGCERPAALRIELP